MSRRKFLIVTSLILAVAVVAWSSGDALAKKPVTKDDQAKYLGKVPPSELKAAEKALKDRGLKPGKAGTGLAAASPLLPPEGPATDTVAIFWKAVITYANPVSISENPASPNSFYLYQNSPNPFNPTTKIKCTIPNVIAIRQLPEKQSQFVTLKVYDVLGNEVATIVNKEQEAGTYEVEFDANSLSSGTYFYKLQAGSFVDTRKMILLR